MLGVLVEKWMILVALSIKVEGRSGDSMVQLGIARKKNLDEERRIRAAEPMTWLESMPEWLNPQSKRNKEN